MVRIARAVLAAAALIALGASSVTAAPSAPSGTPIVIGAVLSITGNYAPLGEPERNALKIAEAEINASGGVAGHPLSIKILDDEGKPDTAQQLVTQLVGEHVAAIIGGTLTPTTLAMTRDQRCKDRRNLHEPDRFALEHEERRDEISLRVHTA